MFRTLLKLTCLATCLALLPACKPSYEAQCTNLLDAIKFLSKAHLRPGLDFNRAVFELALARLYTQNRIPRPKSYSSKPSVQCSYTIKAIRDAHPKKSVNSVLIEILDSYVSFWDPHSSAISEADFATNSSLYKGYGFATERTSRLQRFEIIEVIAGSPAHNAGLQKGMVILSVNRQDVRDKTPSEFAGMINKGEQVVLGVSAPQLAYREVVLKRAAFDVSPVKARLFQNGWLGYLKIRTLVGAEADFAEGLQGLSRTRALILDLRDLSGGRVNTASTLADWLTADATVFAGFISRRAGLREIAKFSHAGSLWDGPVVVLVNAKTKSSAELLAGALQDYGAVVVGQRTFGKGTRQTFRSTASFGISGGVFLTDAFTVRPSGRLVQIDGITPDVELPSFIEASARESDLPAALAAPRSAPSPLSGYDFSAIATQSQAVRQGLRVLEAQLKQLIENGALGHTEEDQQIEAAKRVAMFLAAQAESSESPIQIELPFIDQ